MKALIVLAQPKHGGFNRAVAEASMEALNNSGWETELIDLYADGFDPVLPEPELARKFSFDDKTLSYQEKVLAADRLLFAHPDWWGGPPAVLKGFLDRVFRPGVAYGYREADFAEAGSPGLMAEKRVDVFATTDAPAPESGNVLDWPPAAVWKRSVLDFCGVGDSRVHVFWKLRDSSFAERRAWLDGIGAALG